MRNLFILRGLPGSGKSTWLKENDLEQYAVSSDTLRLLHNSPRIDKNGDQFISQRHDRTIWKKLFEILEGRMENGDFTIVDATHCNNKSFKKYYDLCTKYRYKINVVDFGDISVSVAKERNRNREDWKVVPDEVIDRMFVQMTDLPNKYNVIKPHEALYMLNDFEPLDYSHYHNVVVFGDIHGCMDPLKAYFDEAPFDENTKYIFTGDYIDRGIQNKEVLEFLLTIYDKDNVSLLEGNHEKWLRYYVNDDLNKIRSKEFKEHTIHQIKDMDKKKLKKLCDKLHQQAYFKYKSNVYFVSHGGVPCVPNITISTRDFISGVGDYIDIYDMYDIWDKKTPDNHYLINGHRNPELRDMIHNGTCKCFNLCDIVERGGHLRILNISENSYYGYTIKNRTFRDDLKKEFKNPFLNKLSESSLINRKDLGDNISSFNFKRDCFYKKKWNDLTCKARGLFVNTETENIVVRSYDKFFNLGERDETKIENLVNTLKFPLDVSLKENGYLGLVSYNKETGFFFASKSTNKSDHAKWLEELFFNDPRRDDYVTVLNNYNITMIFEVIDIENDPHIVKYDRSKLALLDIVYNEYEERHLEPAHLELMNKLLNIHTKPTVLTLYNKEELIEFIKEQESKDIINPDAEGYVIEDANKFRFKMKSNYYNFWKLMRTKVDVYYKTSKWNKATDTTLEGDFRAFIMDREHDSTSIADLRDEFFEKYKGFHHEFT